MSVNSFAELYKKLTNTRLLEIINKPGEYEEAAVAAAQEEIDRRSLSENEISEINNEIEAIRNQKLKEEQETEEAKNKLIAAGTTVIKDYGPVRRSSLTPDRLINLICIVFGGLYLYSTIGEFSLIGYLFTANIKWDFSVFMILAQLIVLPVAILLFWLGRKWGWLLLSAYMTYSLFTVLCAFIISMHIHGSMIPLFESYYRRPLPLGETIFYGSVLVAISRRSMRDIYKIEPGHVFWTVLGIGVLTLLFWWQKL